MSEPAPPARRRIVPLPLVIAGVVVFLGAGWLVMRATADTALEAAYKTCVYDEATVPPYAQLGDGGKSLTLDGPRTRSKLAWDSEAFTECVLMQLHRPDHVWSQMLHTTSLAGQQAAQWDDIQATWTYQPDNGFDVVLHVQ